MKIEYGRFGSIKFKSNEVDDGTSTVLLENFLKNIDPMFRPLLSNWIEVDMDSNCRDKDNCEMFDCRIEEVFIKNYSEDTWGEIVNVHLNPLGENLDKKELIKVMEDIIIKLKAK